MWFYDPVMFKDVDLHMSFPNLTLLNMRVGYDEDYPFLLPDLSGCERLESVTLMSYTRLAFPSNLKEKVTEINYI